MGGSPKCGSRDGVSEMGSPRWSPRDGVPEIFTIFHFPFSKKKKSTLCPAINTLQAGSNLINTSPSNLAQSNLVRGLQVDFPKKISDLDFGAPPDLNFEDDCEKKFEVNFDDIFWLRDWKPIGAPTT